MKILAQLALASLSALLMSCSSVPEGPEPDAIVAAPGAFSREAAWHHLKALTEIGERRTGTRGASRARAYLREQLEEMGASVEVVRLVRPASPEDEDGQEAEFTHLLGTLPGKSSDRLLLAASYDTRVLPGVDFVGANASGSGPAVVLELARAYSEASRPYTLVVLLIDGDGLPATDPAARFPGSGTLAAWLAEAGEFATIRLAVFFQQVGDLDLTIARDLRSHPIYREFFWDAASALSREIYFPANAKVESVEGGHLEFIERGLPRTLVIADPRFGGSDVPGRYAATEKDTLERCSPISLGVVGEVALEALARISARLARIDRFHGSPLQDPLGASDGSPARAADPTAPVRPQAPVDASEPN